MRARLARAAGAALLAGAALTGCTTLTPAMSTETSAAESPAPVPSVTTPAPLPTDDTPPSLVPTPPSEDPQAPPPNWSDDELVGACKEAWVATGMAIDWNRYSSDATIEARAGEWYVAFSSSDGSKALECMVSGTPSDATVTTVT